MALSDKDKQAVFQAGVSGGLSEAESRRIAGLPDPTPTGSNKSTTGGTNIGGQTTTSGDSSIMDEITQRLLDSSEAISSGSNRIEQSISDAMGRIESGQEASEEAIRSKFNREIGFQEEQFGQQRETMREGQRGFAVNRAALQAIDERTEKSLRDLEQRKQELILQGEADAASQIADLQLKELQFKQQAEQQAFNNILQVGQFEQSQQQVDLQKKRLQQTIAGDAFDRIQSLRETGIIGDMSEDRLSELEDQAMLPKGAIKAMGNAPKDWDIRSVDGNIVAVDPNTLQIRTLYSGDTENALNVGGVGISGTTAAVINGLQDINDLSPSSMEKVNSELNALGFGSDEAPDWFREKVGGTSRPILGENGEIFQPFATDQFVGERGLRNQWMEFKSNIVLGPKVTPDVVTAYLGSQNVAEVAEESGLTTQEYTNRVAREVNDLINSGMSTKAALDIMVGN